MRRQQQDAARMYDSSPYDLRDPDEIARLLRELEGYMRVSLRDGTDADGRAHAYDALIVLNSRKNRDLRDVIVDSIASALRRAA